MAILAKNVERMDFWREQLEFVAVDKYYTWECKNYGEASASTKALRNYWLKKLLDRQLKEFDRG